MKKKAPDYNLKSIYLRSGVSKLAEDFDPTIGGQRLLGKFRFKPVSANVKVLEPDSELGAKPHGECVVDFSSRFEFRYQAATTENGEDRLEDAAFVEADFVASYERVTAGEPTEEELKNWGNVNTLVHVWPYWREYCASTFQRMNITGALVPLLDVKPPKSTSSQQPQLEDGKAKAQISRTKATVPPTELVSNKKKKVAPKRIG